LPRWGARLLVQALAEAPRPRPQNDGEATYAARIGKNESEIDWAKPAAAVDRLVRAFNPAPGAQTRLGDKPLKIWRARPEAGPRAAPGMVRSADADGIVVACGTDALRILELQRAGGRRVAAGAFLAGFRLAPGARLGGGDG
jgi:methionyl-tRNA formyltransferase